MHTPRVHNLCIRHQTINPGSSESAKWSKAGDYREACHIQITEYQRQRKNLR